MPSFDESFPAIEAALTARYGRPSHPPTTPTDPFRDAVRVLLERVLDARKAGRVVDALDEAGLLDAAVLAKTEPVELIETARAAGVSLNARATGPLIRVARWLVDRHAGAAEAVVEGSVSTAAIREELSRLNGVGPATADALLLLAWQRPVYPVDRATYRILVRHDWLDASADYEDARSAVERPLNDDPAGLAGVSQWFEKLGREFCRASVAKCERCPLQPFLPPDGPREPDGG